MYITNTLLDKWIGIITLLTDIKYFNKTFMQ